MKLCHLTETLIINPFSERVFYCSQGGGSFNNAIKCSPTWFRAVEVFNHILRDCLKSIPHLFTKTKFSLLEKSTIQCCADIFHNNEFINTWFSLLGHWLKKVRSFVHFLHLIQFSYFSLLVLLGTLSICKCMSLTFCVFSGTQLKISTQSWELYILLACFQVLAIHPQYSQQFQQSEQYFTGRGQLECTLHIHMRLLR